MAKFDLDHGLLSPSELADRYFNYQITGQDPDPYGLAVNMSLLYESTFQGTARCPWTPVMDKVFSSAENWQRGKLLAVYSTRQNGDSYYTDFVDALADKYRAIISPDDPREVSYYHATDGAAISFWEDVEASRSGLSVLSPVQNVREFALQAGADQDTLKHVVASAVLDRGRCSSFLSPTPDGLSLRADDMSTSSPVYYDVNAANGTMTVVGKDGVRHEYSGQEALDIVRRGVGAGSVGAIINAEFDNNAADRNLSDKLANGMSVLDGQQSIKPGESITVETYFTKNDEPYFISRSVYSLRQEQDDSNRPVSPLTVDTAVQKTTTFYDPDGNKLIDQNVRRHFRELGLAQDYMSLEEAATDINRQTSGHIDKVFGGLNTGEAIESRTVVVRGRTFDKCDVVVGKTRLDMDALSDVVADNVSVVSGSNFSDTVVTNDNKSWALSVSPDSDIVTAGIPVENGQIIKVFDFSVDKDSGVQIGNVHIPGMQPNEETEFRSLAERYVARGCEKAIADFGISHSSTDVSVNREIPEFDTVSENTQNIDIP